MEIIKEGGVALSLELKVGFSVESSGVEVIWESAKARDRRQSLNTGK